MLERFVTQVFFGTSSESSVRRILLELSVGKMLFGMPSESRVPRPVTTQGLFSSGFPKLFVKGFISSSWWFSGGQRSTWGQDGKCCIRCHLCHWSKPPRKATNKNGRFFSAGRLQSRPSHPDHLEGSQESIFFGRFFRGGFGSYEIEQLQSFQDTFFDTVAPVGFFNCTVFPG